MNFFSKIEICYIFLWKSFFINKRFSSFSLTKSFIMKYFNKTRTIEQKVTDREILFNLNRQTELLKAILVELKKGKNP